MKLIYTVIILAITTSNVCYAHNEWIPYYQPAPSPPTVFVPTTPVITYSTPETILPRPLVLTYDWVPYLTTKTIVIEKQGFICKHRSIVSQPVIEWIYQPVWK